MLLPKSEVLLSVRWPVLDISDSAGRDMVIVVFYRSESIHRFPKETGGCKYRC